MKPARTIEIGLVSYPESQQAAVLGLTDLFVMGGRVAARHRKQTDPVVRVSHWRQEKPGASPTRVFDSAPGSTEGLTALIAPPSLIQPIDKEKAATWVSWLRAQHSNGVILSSVCAGAFLLAETGLLEGRTVTTHWVYADQFRQRFSGIRLDIDRLVIDDGDLVTAGGLMAWTDLGLRLLARFLGPTVMVETARLMLLDPPGREQRYYSAFSPNLTHGDAAVLKVQHWMQARAAKEIALPKLAAKAGLESRTLMRRFQKATGMTTTEYAQHLRVGKARELLQFATASIDKVAWDVGYGDPGAFRKVFTRIVGLTPGDYRRRFRAA